MRCGSARRNQRFFDYVSASSGTWSRRTAEACSRFNVPARAMTRRKTLGAPGWDRTSNPCLRRAVLYPLSYGRIEAEANAAAGKSHRIQRLRSRVHAGDAGEGSPEVSQPPLLAPRTGVGLIILRYLRRFVALALPFQGALAPSVTRDSPMAQMATESTPDKGPYKASRSRELHQVSCKIESSV